MNLFDDCTRHLVGGTYLLLVFNWLQVLRTHLQFGWSETLPRANFSEIAGSPCEWDAHDKVKGQCGIVEKEVFASGHP